MGIGRISVLVSKEFQVLAHTMRGLDKEVKTQLRKHTKQVVAPVWEEAVRGRVVDRMQTRVLSDTARVAVSDQNIMLRSGGIGKTSSGIPNSVIAKGVEFGADRASVAVVTNSKGTKFSRHTRRQFKLPRRGGYVVFPAAAEVIPRMFSLWIQTTIRTTHEQFEEGGAS